MRRSVAMLGLLGGCALLGGCDVVFRLDHVSSRGDGSLVGNDDASTVDAGPSYACTFGTALLVPEITANFEDPAQSIDKRELFLSLYDSTVALSHIFVSRRTSPGGPWGVPIAEMQLSSNYNDEDPVLALDDTMVLFMSTRAGGTNRVFQSTRASVEDSFGIPAIVFNSLATGIDVSPDGLTLYVCDGNGTLAAITRSSTTAQFMPTSATVIATGVYWPSVAGDGLTVYYHRNTTLYRQTRTSTTAPFSMQTELAIATGTDANISDDGRELLFFTDTSLARATCN